MTAEDKKVDECVTTICCIALKLILLGRILNMEIDKQKDQKPRHKPKGKWRFKQYEEWDKK